MKTTLVLLLLCGAALAAPVDRVVGGIERAPTAEDARSAGAQALIDYAADASHPLLRRVRAIAALRFVPGEPARAFLIDLLAHEGKSPAATPFEISAAVGALAPYKRTDLILPYVAHASPDVRLAAAGALRLIGDAMAINALRARFAVERDPGVRVVVEASLRDRAR